MHHTIKTYPYECSRKCQNREHANAIIVALTRHDIGDELLAAYIAKMCCNFCNNTNEMGYTAAHTAAAAGRYRILEWLINMGCNINATDTEGMTPLHWAMGNGWLDCAVLLLRYGANPEIYDNAMHHACYYVQLQPFIDDHCEPQKDDNEVLVWGANRNYNLGIKDRENDTCPQHIDFFGLAKASVKKAAIGSFHSMFLDSKLNLYAVGHGEGGRLGIKNNSVVKPTLVRLPFKKDADQPISVSVSSKHSLILTANGAVYACGLNDHGQLGIPGAGAKSTHFREVKFDKYSNVTVRSIYARDSYSLAMSDSELFIWGANNGQVGQSAELKCFQMPRLVKLVGVRDKRMVSCNDVAIVIAMLTDAVVCYGYKMRTLRAPDYQELKGIAVTGGSNPTESKGTPTALKVALLTVKNDIYLWYETTQQFYQCFYPNDLKLGIDQMFLKGSQMLIRSGRYVYEMKCQQETYVGNNVYPSQRASAEYDEWIVSKANKTMYPTSNTYRIRLEVKRLPNLDRVKELYVSNDFTSFCALQESHLKYFNCPTVPAMEYNFRKLYESVSQDDCIHDAVFILHGQRFPVHKLIIYARAAGLRQLLEARQDCKEVSVEWPNMTVKMFQLLLKNIYVNYFPNLNDIDELTESHIADRTAVVENLLNHSEKCKLDDLTGYLLRVLMHLQEVTEHACTERLPLLPSSSQYRFKYITHADFPELYDVRIICSDNVEIFAHKCVLVSSTDYFEVMFSNNWAEQEDIQINDVSGEYMLPIVEFLYCPKADGLLKSNQFIYNTIALCDQFLIERLREMCELVLLQKLSLRKCGEMLDVAHTYNCDLLKRACMQYICQNLERVLTYRSLEYCETDPLRALTQFYRSRTHTACYQDICPVPNAMSDEEILSFVSDFTVDLSYRMDEHELGRDDKSKRGESHKIVHATRQHEKEAISSMMEDMTINTATLKSPAEPSTAADCSWRKVRVKREKRKSETCETSEPITPLKSTHTPERCEPESPKYSPRIPETPVNEVQVPMRAFDLNLSEIAAITPNAKLSQKTRKRLLSNRAKQQPALASSPTVAAPATALPPVTPNAWGVSPSINCNSNSNAAATGSQLARSPPPTGSLTDPTSFANIARHSRSLESERDRDGDSDRDRDGQATDFARILAEEKRQREYTERMRHRSLELNQIEEQAIADLRQFYNVDNVDDEVITIERVPASYTADLTVVGWRK